VIAMPASEPAIKKAGSCVDLESHDGSVWSAIRLACDIGGRLILVIAAITGTASGELRGDIADLNRFNHPEAARILATQPQR